MPGIDQGFGTAALPLGSVAARRVPDLGSLHQVRAHQVEPKLPDVLHPSPVFRGGRLYSKSQVHPNMLPLPVGQPAPCGPSPGLASGWAVAFRNKRWKILRPSSLRADFRTLRSELIPVSLRNFFLGQISNFLSSVLFLLLGDHICPCPWLTSASTFRDHSWWCFRDQIWVGHMQGKHLTHCLLL